MAVTHFHCHLMSYFDAVDMMADYTAEAAFTCPNLL